MAEPPAVLHLTTAQGDAMLAHLRACLPEEGCGILAGWEGRVTAVRPITNALHSPVRFRMDAQEQLEAFLWLEAQGYDLLAIFHSHPAGPPVPSETDIAEFFYPEALALIWAPTGGDGWQVRAFTILDGHAHEIPIFWNTASGPEQNR